MQSQHKENCRKEPLQSRRRTVMFGVICFFSVLAWSDDRAVLDQLYREIMNAPDAAVIRDSALPAKSGRTVAAENEPLPSPVLEPAFDPASDKLQQEIQKMVEDAKFRYDDAVKFMQENK